jgi:hypothetical protein
MPHISVNSRTYRRLVRLAEDAGITVHAAATDAIDNWIDIANDPRLAVTALTAIGEIAPAPLAVAMAYAGPIFPPNVTYIDAVGGRSPQHRLAALRRHREATSGEASG